LQQPYTSHDRRSVTSRRPRVQPEQLAAFLNHAGYQEETTPSNTPITVPCAGAVVRKAEYERQREQRHHDDREQAG